MEFAFHVLIIVKNATKEFVLLVSQVSKPTQLDFAFLNVLLRVHLVKTTNHLLVFPAIVELSTITQANLALWILVVTIIPTVLTVDLDSTIF
jgi:hypothetical protein